MRLQSIGVLLLGSATPASCLRHLLVATLQIEDFLRNCASVHILIILDELCVKWLVLLRSALHGSELLLLLGEGLLLLAE